MEPIRKALRIKEVGDKGIITAVFATMNVIDKDGDVTLPGFFGRQEVAMLPAHDRGSVPLGKGVIEEVGDEAIATLRMNLDIQKARDWYSALKFDFENGTPLQEWSYSLRIHDGGSTAGQFEGQDVNFLGPLPDGSPGVKSNEVSPVLIGAGEDTRTIDVKSADNAGDTFLGQAKKALASLKEMTERAEALAVLREKQSRVLSAANLEKLGIIRGESKALMDRLDVLLADESEESRNELRKIYLGHLKGSRGGC